MADNESPSSAILYRNVDSTIVLLDLPKSISLAQGTLDHPCPGHIYSSPALEAPYPSTEPKSEKAKANVLRTNVPVDSNLEFPTTLLHQALEEISHHWGGRWCLMRKISTSVTAGRSKKRKLLAAEDPPLRSNLGNASRDLCQPLPAISSSTTQKSVAPPLIIEPDLSIPEDLPIPRKFSEPLTLPVDLSSAVHVCSNIEHIINKVVNNACIKTVSLFHAGTSFRIPPNASFIISKINEATAPVFSMGALTLYPAPSATAGPGQFDFILLDPPWKNRSVKRSAKYETMCDTDPLVPLQSFWDST